MQCAAHNVSAVCLQWRLKGSREPQTAALNTLLTGTGVPPKVGRGPPVSVHGETPPLWTNHAVVCSFIA
jgi:hypothetical protein